MTLNLDIKYRRLKSLSRPISEVGFGCWALGGAYRLGGREIGWGNTDQDGAIEAIKVALDSGVNFFDTADIYGGGQADQLLARALNGRDANSIIIATKFGNREDNDGKAVHDFSKEWMLRSVEGSLRRLNRDYIDIMLLHSPPDDFDWSTYDITALEALKSSGKIRSYGVSCRGTQGALNVLRHKIGDVVEVLYNALNRKADEEVIPVAHRLGIGVIARVPLASGFLTHKVLMEDPKFESTDIRSSYNAEELQWRLTAVRKLKFLDELQGGISCAAIQFCLSHPAVTTVIPGMRTVTQVRGNLMASRAGPLSKEVMEKICQAVPESYKNWP